jgi:RNA polymerase sigma-70 factor (ECF subfamily)
MTVLEIALMELDVEAAEALGSEPDAFSDFYEVALPRVYGYFLHRCGGSVPLAEDLTQETFLAAVAELRKGRRVDAPIRWIYGIARHKLLDHYRSRERVERATAFDPDPKLSEIVVDENADDVRDHAVAALVAVPASQRSVLVLCYLDGFSVQEIAASLGKSTAAVHSLLERGRASFKSAYLEAAS